MLHLVGFYLPATRREMTAVTWCLDGLSMNHERVHMLTAKNKVMIKTPS